MIVYDIEKLCNLVLLNLPHKPLLSIDYGVKKIGIAISDNYYNVAMPLFTIYECSEDKQISNILKILNQYLIRVVVVGLPLDMNGESCEQARRTEKFVAKLDMNIVDGFLYMQDERFTTRAAHQLLRFANIKSNKKQNDAIAASMILETTLYLIRAKLENSFLT